ncbi:MAG: transcriptional repressor [Alphaproteobacteria bacterium]|nr:transcriptional repressor [Alphaproteobacteria bacterium]MBV9061334.1 transcriptional repressor [Alphaproteobacteria bacterium]
MKVSRKRKTLGAEEAVERLRAAGLRPTRQRVALAQLLGDAHRHISAEGLHREAGKAGMPVALATIYNTLHQFTEAKLLREVVVGSGRSYFDTNTGDHQHFYCEDDGTLIDIEGNAIEVAGVPTPPKGMAVDRVDVVVRVKRS